MGDEFIPLATVVTRKDNQRVVDLTDLLQFCDNAAHAFVEALYHGGFAGIVHIVVGIRIVRQFLLVLFDIRGFAGDGPVNGVVGQIEEEGLIFLAFHEIDGSVGEHVGEAFVLAPLAFEIGEFVIGWIEEVSSLIGRMIATDVFIKAVFLGHVLGMQGGDFGKDLLIASILRPRPGDEMPLAKERGGIPLFLHGFGQQDAFVIEVRLPVGCDGFAIDLYLPRYPVGQMQARRRTPGQQGRATRRTEGAARIGLSKAHPFGGERIDVGRFVEFAGVAVEFTGAEIIDKKEHDVGLAGFPGLNRGGDEAHR